MGSETEMRQQPEDATVKDDKSPLPSAAVEGIEGNKRSRLVSVRAIVTSSHPYHVTGQPYHWTRSTALSLSQRNWTGMFLARVRSPHGAAH